VSFEMMFGSVITTDEAIIKIKERLQTAPTYRE